jgi:hypothetical protein
MLQYTTNCVLQLSWSGRSIPQYDTFVTLTHYDSVVETANGGVVRVTHRGSVKVLMSDTFRPDHTIVVNLHNVLHVPGLNKGLLLVHEWNSCNGQIYDMTDPQRVEIYDDDKKACAMVDLPPCLSLN